MLFCANVKDIFNFLYKLKKSVDKVSGPMYYFMWGRLQMAQRCKVRPVF